MNKEAKIAPVVEKVRDITLIGEAGETRLDMSICSNKVQTNLDEREGINNNNNAVEYYWAGGSLVNKKKVTSAKHFPRS
jgi:hypothetical protein